MGIVSQAINWGGNKNLATTISLFYDGMAGSPYSCLLYTSKGSFPTHMVGIIGGLIWGLGTVLSFMAAGKAGAAISYGLGQGATMVAALWGVFIWKEFKGGGRNVNLLLFLMFVLFISGLALIILSGGN